ncbi:MAG: zinc ribbon domain-containing protein, partial [Candidatus Eremiobacterota bacterium]
QEKEVSRELSSRLKFMALFADQLRQQYKSSKELRQHTSLLRELDPHVRREMERLRSGLKRIHRWFEEPRPEHLEEGCRESREAADSLLDAFDRLRGEEETFPVFSQSPPVNELVNVAMGVNRGTTPDEALRTRLEGFYNHWKRTLADAKEWEKSPPENEQVAAELPGVKSGLDLMTRGLREMSRYFSDKDKEHLRKGCDLILRASEGLLELRKRVLEAAVPSVPCPRCSRSNPPGSKICGGCNARLPELPGSGSSTLEVHAEAPGQTRFAYVVRLEEAVEACLEGRLSAKELRPTVEWFAANVRQGKRSLDALKPPAIPNEDLRRGLEEARRLMDDASVVLVEGVDRLERYFADPSREHLDEGLERVRRGAALMFESQERMRALGMGAPT